MKKEIAKLVCVALVLCGIAWSVSPQTMRLPHTSDIISPSLQRKIDGQIWIWRMQWWATSNNWNRD
jgi:hypothetical protein